MAARMLVVNPIAGVTVSVPMISDVSDIVDEVVYLTEARHVTGEVLHVDGGAHSSKG